MVSVIKKDGTRMGWDSSRIRSAVTKASQRASSSISDAELKELIGQVYHNVVSDEDTEVSVSDIHSAVTQALGEIKPAIQKSYQDYRDYKTSFVKSLDEIFVKTKDTLYFGDRENANFDSSLISTKGSIIRGYLTKELYKNFYLSKDELQLIEDGFIYIHDLRDLIFGGFNCCLFDIGAVLKGGFEMSGIEYQEPKTVLSALQVIGDVVLSATAQQFGGFTLPELDKVLVPYVLKSYDKHKADAKLWGIDDGCYPLRKVEEELSQGFQSLEMKLNTVPCSRGDFAFTTISFGNLPLENGLHLSAQGLVCKAILLTRMEGQGKNHKPVVFPKLVYLHSKEAHDKSIAQQVLFDLAVQCCSKAMYPDFLDIDQKGAVADTYKKTGQVVSPMGCVDADEVLTFKYNGVVYNKSFGDMWNLVSPDYELEYKGVTEYVRPKELYVKDIDAHFTLAKVLLKNPDKGDWKLLKFTNGRSLVCTGDHPLPVNGKGRTYVKDMVLGDTVNLEPMSTTETDIDSYSADVATLKGVVSLGYTGRPSYDVTTESDTFCVSGLCSHNCRSYLSEYQTPEGDYITTGRANIGVVSLNLPMIIQQAHLDGEENIYRYLNRYLEFAVDFLKKRYEVIANMPCSSNPLAFTQGGMYGGNKRPEEKIGFDIVKGFTASIGITALDESCILLFGCHLHEATEAQKDAMEDILHYINMRLEYYKKRDGYLYSLYGTPAESLCGTQLKQFREKFGIIKGVSDKEYFTNSFHMNVAADITPLEKQDLEEKLFHLCAGGHIQYTRLSNPDNLQAIKSIVKRGMGKGFYQGVNFDLAICEHCHTRTKNTESCDKCGSTDISVINRVCGYLGWTKLNGKSRMNDAKLAEIKDRKSM